MARYSNRVVVVDRHEWLVPIDSPYGACWTDVYKAVSAAHQELWALGLVEQDRDASDDSIRMEFDDENIIVFFVIRKDGDSVRLQ
jgi:hypothetical protein